jgi:competence protein ComEA
VAELCTLPGIGQKRAEAIVLHRVRHGWFQAVAGLCEVDGLGPETVAQLAAHAFAGQPTVPGSVR